jgi:hypothetical protein
MRNQDHSAKGPHTDEPSEQPLFRRAEKPQRAKATHPTDARQIGRLVAPATKRLGALIEAVPEEVKEHQRNASRERLLAWRALIDARLASLDRRQGETAADV